VAGGLAVAALCAVLASSASAVVVRTPGGRFFGVTPRPGATLSRSGGSDLHASPHLAALTSTGALEYHGGPVLHTTRPYLVFWDPASAIAPSARTLLQRYLSDTAADSALGDDVLGVTRQYSDATGYAAAGETYAAPQAVLDHQPYPTSGACSEKPAPLTACLTDAQLQAELQRLIAAAGLPSGTGPGAPVYFVVTPATVNVCLTGSECADNYFCAYHANFHQPDGGDVIYAPVPLLSAVKDCQTDGIASLQDPNGIAADVAVDNLSHEYNESITDPDGDAWYDDGSQNEEADYCQAYAASRDPLAGADPDAYAPALGTAPDGSLYDQRIAGDLYYTQSEWSNGQGDCELASSADPLTSTIVAPQTGASGTAVRLLASATTATHGVASTTWSFGDGSAAFNAGAPAAQAHTYAAPGVYTVSMSLVDGSGQVATFTRPLAVAVAPVASFTQSTGLAGAPLLTHVAFDASASHDSNPAAHIVSYRWEFGDGTVSFQGPATGYLYTTPGSYTVKLTVISSDGLSATVSRPIRVVSVPEVALAWRNAYPVAGHAITFDGTPRLVGAAHIVSYRWEFGDGRTGTGAHVTHTFRRSGAYWVTVGLTTADGLTRTDSRLLQVKPVEAITKLALSASPRGALRLKVTVNGPGLLRAAGHSSILAKAGSISYGLALTRAQRRALRGHGQVVVRVPVRFKPRVGRAIVRTARLTLTG
jgi:PKD repeat protein